MPVTWLQKSSQTLLDLLLPPRCVHCQSAAGWLCPDCIKKIDFISAPVCKRCGTVVAADYKASGCRQCRDHPPRFIDGIRSAAHFDDNPIRSAIHTLKYRNQKVVAQVLAQFLVAAYQRFELAADVIVPVPLHSARLRERGYNQSELLASALGDQVRLPVNTSTLQRVRHTKSQMTLGAEERHQNVAEAFRCADQQLVNRRILLLDDVCTTGSTLDACAAALKQSKAALVWGLTLAKAR